MYWIPVTNMESTVSNGSKILKMKQITTHENVYHCEHRLSPMVLLK